MNLQTQIPLNSNTKTPINYKSKTLLLGSCFSNNIGEKLAYYKFQSTVNPLGILFHPKAIETLILNAINKKTYLEKDVFFINERWHCFDAHSIVSKTNKDDLLKTLNNTITLINRELRNVTHIIITLGTSWVYRFIEKNTIVANCHKIPQKKFLKEILSVNEIIESLEAILSLIKNINPTAKVIFTISPVRHLKDGFVENQQSKAHLVSAIHTVLSSKSELKGFYFPSYEILMDELRDYRFYAEDMIHPNQIAVNYIWEKFIQVWVSKEAQNTMKEIENIQNSFAHRPFNSDSKLHQQFLKNLHFKVEKLQKKHSFITF